MKRTFLIAIIGTVAAVIVLAFVATGFLSAPVNNPCPYGQCPPAGGGTVPYTVIISGRVINPSFAPPYAVVDSVVAFAASPAALSFQIPKLDFWTNNFVVTGNSCITYPSGNTYCTGGSMGPAPSLQGSAPGGGQAAFKLYLYENGPHGSYIINVNLYYVQTGCVILQCVAMTAPMSTTFTL
jgi:hypothetical protein